MASCKVPVEARYTVEDGEITAASTITAEVPAREIADMLAAGFGIDIDQILDGEGASAVVNTFENTEAHSPGGNINAA